MTFVSSYYLSAEITEAEYNNILLNNFQKIVSAYNQRKFEAQDNKQKLLSGYWYAKDYLDLLIKHKQNNRKNWLLEKDYFRKYFVDNKSSLQATYSGFMLKPFVNTADVFTNFGENLIFIDCSMAVQVAHYQTLLEIFGGDKFNKIFKFSNEPLISTSLHNTQLFKFLQQKDIDDISFLGAHTYIPNHLLYAMKHIYGTSNGFHVMVSQIESDNTKFIGFSLPDEGLTKEEIQDHLVKKFNINSEDKLLVTQNTWNNEMLARTGFALLKFQVLPTITISSINDQDVWNKFAIALQQIAPANFKNLAVSYVENIKSQREDIVKQHLGSFKVNISLINVLKNKDFTAISIVNNK